MPVCYSITCCLPVFFHVPCLSSATRAICNSSTATMLVCLVYFISFFISHNHLNQRGSLRSINTTTLFLVNDQKKSPSCKFTHPRSPSPPEQDRLINPCTARCPFEQPLFFPLVFLIPPPVPTNRNPRACHSVAWNMQKHKLSPSLT